MNMKGDLKGENNIEANAYIFRNYTKFVPPNLSANLIQHSRNVYFRSHVTKSTICLKKAKLTH